MRNLATCELDKRRHLVTLLSGAVALSHCIFHSVTTCSTPPRYQELAAMRNLATCELDKRRHPVTLLSGAVALSLCIFHSVTTCSTPSLSLSLSLSFLYDHYLVFLAFIAIPYCSQVASSLSIICWISMSPCVHVSMSPCLHVSMSPCLHVSMSPCLHVSMSPCLQVSMSPCLHVSMSTCLHVSMSPCLHVSMYPCIHVSMYPCLHVSMSPCIHVSMYPCLHVSMSPCLHVSMSPCLLVSMYPCIHVFMSPCLHVFMSPWSCTQSLYIPLRHNVFDHTRISYGDPTMVYKHRRLICSMTRSTWGYIKHHLVTDHRSNWKRLLSGAVALSHCIVHSVTTCSTPSRCVPLRHDLAIQKYALTNIHNYVIPWWRTIEATGNACCLVQLHSVTVYSTPSQRVPLRHVLKDVIKRECMTSSLCK